MSGNGKGGNSSTSGSNTRTTPYNTRNNGKGGSYTSLNNPTTPTMVTKLPLVKKPVEKKVKNLLMCPKTLKQLNLFPKKSWPRLLKKFKTLWPSTMTLKRKP